MRKTEFSFNLQSGQEETSTPKYQPVIGSDIIGCKEVTTKIHCVTAMKEYESNSLEELRLKDYLANGKINRQSSFENTVIQNHGTFGPSSSHNTFGIVKAIPTENHSPFCPNPKGFSPFATTSALGMTNTSTTENNNPFGSNSISKSSFGFPVAADATTPTFAFGKANTTATENHSIFGSNAISKSSFGFPVAADATTPTFAFGKANTTATENRSIFGSNTLSKSGFGFTAAVVATKSLGATTPVFGIANTTSKENQSTFGSKSNKSIFGSSTTTDVTKRVDLSSTSFGIANATTTENHTTFGSKTTLCKSIFGSSTTESATKSHNPFMSCAFGTSVPAPIKKKNLFKGQKYVSTGITKAKPNEISSLGNTFPEKNLSAEKVSCISNKNENTNTMTLPSYFCWTLFEEKLNAALDNKLEDLAKKKDILSIQQKIQTNNFVEMPANEIDGLRMENKKLKAELNVLQYRIEELEKMNRRCRILVRGLNCNESNSAINEFMKLCTSCLDTEVHITDCTKLNSGQAFLFTLASTAQVFAVIASKRFFKYVAVFVEKDYTLEEQKNRYQLRMLSKKLYKLGKFKIRLGEFSLYVNDKSFSWKDGAVVAESQKDADFLKELLILIDYDSSVEVRERSKKDYRSVKNDLRTIKYTKPQIQPDNMAKVIKSEACTSSSNYSMLSDIEDKPQKTEAHVELLHIPKTESKPRPIVRRKSF